MSLIQVNVPDDIKQKADAAFARNGITTPAAMKMLITQVAETGKTPLDGVFVGDFDEHLPHNIRRLMLKAEAIEYGLIPDDSKEWTGDFDDETLEILGLTREEVEGVGV